MNKVENFSQVKQKPQATHHHPNFFKTNFNIIFPSAPISSKLTLSFGLSR